jgi:uncharacterized membrane protein YfcA
MELSIILLIFFLALICEFIDSSLGMLYGTILSPILILMGFNPLLVIPSILLTQAIGGLTASIFHNKLKNADFSFKNIIVGNILKKEPTQDLKIVLLITVLGVTAAIFSGLIAVNIPKEYLKTYIGIIVAVMGGIIISKKIFNFSWKKIMVIGILSAFNKAISGGGFGPVVTAGQIISGRKEKNAIGTTTLAEAPICIVGFLTYFLTKGIANWNLVFILGMGAFLGSIFGPFFTSKFKEDKKLKIVLGLLALTLGIFLILDTWILHLKGVGA